MTKNIPKNKRLLEKLRAKNPKIVLDTIAEMRKSGDKSLVPALVEVLHETKSFQVQQKIVALLNDLKDQAAAGALVAAIEADKYQRERQSLVAACWQNGLDYSAFLPVFVRLVLSESYAVAVEAFTVVENLESKPSQAHKAEAISQLKEQSPCAPPEKQPLLVELVSVLEKM